jgi:hypothetical protein
MIHEQLCDFLEMMSDSNNNQMEWQRERWKKKQIQYKFYSQWKEEKWQDCKLESLNKWKVVLDGDFLEEQ